MVTCFAAISAWASMTPDRWVELLGLPEDSYHRGFLMEASCVAFIFAVLTVAPLFARVSSRSCIVLVHFASIAYIVAASALGSFECEVIAAGHEIRGSRVYRHFILVLMVYIAGVLGCIARRDQEREEYSVFMERFWFYQDAESAKKRNRLGVVWATEVQVAALAIDSVSTLATAHSSRLVEEEIVKHRSTMVRSCTLENRSEGFRPAEDDEFFKVRPPQNAGERPSLLTEPERLEPNEVLVRAMSNAEADWPRIRKMAENCCNPSYQLAEFFEDCLVSFPELHLFFLTKDDILRASSSCTVRTTSGRPSEAEYQRTIGALFAVFWLLRLDIDGRESFCFGVDENWQAPVVPINRERDLEAKLFVQMTDEEKRYRFFAYTDWSMFEDVVRRSGCTADAPGQVERIMALLCLTSFHDIMKVEELLPEVQPEHSPYCGYEAGCRINDHDTALCYILEYYPQLIPSFEGLPAEERKSILFTQSEMKFNHGWFVQAETPPGVMLSRFKSAMSAGVRQAEVALYFFHWITDLAGAQATPLGGAEKFVLKFPHAVLTSFLWSIPYLSNLIEQTETAVVEDYLAARWKQHTPDLPVPSDSAAVARMRLLVMSQGQREVLDLYKKMSRLDQLILAQELQRTGIDGQSYTCNMSSGGPALFLYYGPALLQRNVTNLKDLDTAIRLMVQTFKAARQMWPVRKELESTTVSIQVGELKSMPILDVLRGKTQEVESESFPGVWVLMKQNAVEGVVRLFSLSELNEIRADSDSYRVLHLDQLFQDPSFDECLKDDDQDVVTV